MNNSAHFQAASRPRHYIIVVHGIGEQKLNETTTPVVHRFAEARKEKAKSHFKNLLPSYLSAQSVQQSGKGHGWSEFKGIPVDKNNDTGEFDGTPATDSSGQNFRFVDLHWQHILQRHQARYASPVDQWAPSLLARLEDENITPRKWLSPWAFPLLHSIVRVVLPVKNMLAFKNQELTKKIFNNFLGDVHLYGDYSRTRGRAVRHFHVILDEIMLRDFIDWCYRDMDLIKREKEKGNHIQPSAYQPPDFTIIAHSLGSIMSFDALVYANANEEVRLAQGAAWNSCPSLPFLGYAGLGATDPQVKAEKESWNYFIGELQKLKEENNLDTYKGNFPKGIDRILKQTSAPEIPVLTWRGRVKNFITLGSPIDKYHVLWWQKYLHMGLKRDGCYPDPEWRTGVDGWLNPPDQKIKHYNFCDEQDPVGHHLDVARGTENYGKIFNPDPVSDRDIVFRRYAKPGVAHVMYWEDKELFQGLIEQIISPDETSTSGFFRNKNFREGPKAFKQALLWAYFRIPFFTAALTGLLIIYAIFGETPIYRIAAGLGAVLLWVQLSLSKAYKDEANPEDFDETRVRQKIKTSPLGKWRIQPGIFARLVAGMVEWRRVLLKLSEGSQSALDSQIDSNRRVAFVTAKSNAWSFWWRFLLRIFVASVVFSYFIGLTIHNSPSLESVNPSLINILWREVQNSLVTAIGIVLPLTYILTMMYVAFQFVWSKYFRQ